MLHIQYSPYIRDIHYESANDFIRAISYDGELYELFNEHYIFRGHSTDQCELLPSALRGYLALEGESLKFADTEEEKNVVYFFATTEIAQIQKEYKLLQDFFLACDYNGLYVPHIESLRNSFYPGVDGETLFLEGKWLPKEYWELASLAQHHGVKTRLLDWTHDLFVALYFASTGVYNDPKEKLDLRKALAARRKGEKYPPHHNIEIWALDIDVVMAKPMLVPLKLVQPQYHNNDNLCAQKGMFTFWETIKPAMIRESDGKLNAKAKTDRRSLDVQLHEYLNDINAPARHYLYHITIPQDAAYTIYSYIEHLGYNASTLFPGYDGVVRFLDERLRILDNTIPRI